MYRTAAFWDRIADKYASAPIRNQESYQYTLERTRQYLHVDDKMLEIGCGTGLTALELAPLVSEIVATDISSAMLAKGRARVQEAAVDNITFAQADAQHAPNGPFDVVTAFNLLHLAEDLDGTLKAIAARTKPGGVFISKTFCMPEGLSWITLLVTVALPVMQAIGKAPYFVKLKARDLDAAIIAAGFTLIETGQGPTNDPRRYLVARRDG
jgi:ubiquinone/menaquinone biosynthesis C-methylase UbiE